MAINRLLFLLIFPLTVQCQDRDIPVSNIETVEHEIDLNVMCHDGFWGYSTSFQLDESGVGLVSMTHNRFLLQKEIGSAIDTFPVPDGYNPNFFNVLSNGKGKYFFLDSGLGLFELTEKAPVFLDSINANPVLRNDGLMILNSINVAKNAQFTDENHLIIPLIWNYFNPQGKYKDWNKPAPLFCEYNLQTKQIRLLSYMTPPELFKNDFNNMERQFFSCVKGDTLVISYPYKSETTLFSISKNEVIGTIDCKSSFQLEPIATVPKLRKKKLIIERERYKIETANYGPLFYNKERNEYYRIFYHAQPRKNENDEYTIIQDKASSILVLDKDLHLKREILCKKNAYIILGVTCTSKGFILNSFTPMKDGKRSSVEIVL